MNGKGRAAALVIFSAVICSGCSSTSPGEVKGENIGKYLPDKNIKENVFLGDMNVGGYGKKELHTIMNRLARDIDKKSADAVLDSKKWVVASPEKTGQRINIEKTIDTLFNAQSGQKIEPFVEEVRPLITAGQLRKNIVQIAEFSTPIRDKTPSRTKNIAVAAQKLDFVQIKPGVELSFNKAVGQRTLAEGFSEGPIIIRTDYGVKKDNDVGGGICQVSTTLFNAVQQCGLEITERHMHSGDITYAPKGKDATVYYGSADFRFRNNRSHPVMLRMGMGANTFSVKIFENRN